MKVTNTLAYHGAELITTVKSFIVLKALSVNVIYKFSFNTDIEEI